MEQVDSIWYGGGCLNVINIVFYFYILGFVLVCVLVFFDVDGLNCVVVRQRVQLVWFMFLFEGDFGNQGYLYVVLGSGCCCFLDGFRVGVVELWCGCVLVVFKSVGLYQMYV